MRPGKIAESVLKRSVLKQIKTQRSEVIQGAEVGADCALFSIGKNIWTALSTTPIVVEDAENIGMQLAAAVNNVAAAGAEPVGVIVSVILPDKILEAELQHLSAEAERAGRKLNLQIAGGNTEITTAVTKPILNLTIVGKKKPQTETIEYESGDDIIMTKWTGLAGTSILAKANRAKLEQRLPAYIVDTAAKFDSFVSVLPEARIAVDFGIKGMHDVSRGGVFAAIWELAERHNAGVEIDLRKIPIRQETVEVCELLETNPYELYGAGALLIVTDQGEQLVEKLEQNEIPAAIVGKIISENGKKIINGDEIRFLDRPKKDSLFQE